MLFSVLAEKSFFMVYFWQECDIIENIRTVRLPGAMSPGRRKDAEIHFFDGHPDERSLNGGNHVQHE